MKPSSRCMICANKPGLHVVLVRVYRLSCAFSLAVAATTSSTGNVTSITRSWNQGSSGNVTLFTFGACAALIVVAGVLCCYCLHKKEISANTADREIAVVHEQHQQPQPRSQGVDSPELQKYIRNTLVDKIFPITYLLKPPRTISEHQAAALLLAATELLERFPEYNSEPKIVLCFDDGARSADLPSCGPGTFFAASITKHLWEHDMPCVSKLMLPCEQEAEKPWLFQRGIATQPHYKSWFKTCRVVVVVETVSLYISVECLQEIFMAIECKAVVVVVRFEDCLPEVECQWPTVLIDSEEQQQKVIVQSCLSRIQRIPAPPTTIPANAYHLNKVRQAIECHVPKKTIDWANCKTTHQMLTACEKGKIASKATMAAQMMMRKKKRDDRTPPGKSPPIREISPRSPQTNSKPVETGPQPKLEKNAARSQPKPAKLKNLDRTLVVKSTPKTKDAKKAKVRRVEAAIEVANSIRRNVAKKTNKHQTEDAIEAANLADPDRSRVVESSPVAKDQTNPRKKQLQAAKLEAPGQNPMSRSSPRPKLDVTKQQLETVNGDSDQSQVVNKGQKLKCVSRIPPPPAPLTSPPAAAPLTSPSASPESSLASLEKPKFKNRSRPKHDNTNKRTSLRRLEDTSDLSSSVSSVDVQQHLLSDEVPGLDRKGGTSLPDAVTNGILKKMSMKIHASFSSARSTPRSPNAAVVGRAAEIGPA